MEPTSLPSLRDFEPTTDGDGVAPLSEDERPLGSYQLCFELASGGMATIYLARAEYPGEPSRVVALKRIHPHLAKEEDFVHMFVDEARIASRVKHANVCEVFDVGVADGAHYIAMEFVLGETLSRLARVLARRADQADAPWVPIYVAYLMAEVADGLHAAHELRDEDGIPLDVVHRDVSPQNVFVTYDGGVRIVDFGIARASGRLHQTRTGALKGKLAYLAPEAIHKVPLDRRADIFALGVVMWELVCGQRLFKRESELDMLLAVANEPILEPIHVRATVPEELSRIVMKTLERERDKRYASAALLAQDLREFIKTSGVPVGREEIAEWMDELFHDAKQRRLELVERASVMTGAMEQAPAGVAEASSSPSKSLPGPKPEAETDPRAKALAAAAAAARAREVPTLTEDGRAKTPTRALRKRKSTEDAPQAASVVAKDGPQLELVRRAKASGWIAVGVVLGFIVTYGLGRAVRATGRDDAATTRAAETAANSGSSTTPTSADRTPQRSGAQAAVASPTPPGDAPRQAATAAPIPPPALVDSVVPPPSPTLAASPAGTDTSDEPAPDAPVDTAPDRRVNRTRRRVTRPAPAPDPIAQRGAVNVATPGGWADIYVDGARVGRSPAQVLLAPGRHTVELRPFGNGSPQRQQITVHEGSSARIVVRLTP